MSYPLQEILDFDVLSERNDPVLPRCPDSVSEMSREDEKTKVKSGIEKRERKTNISSHHYYPNNPEETTIKIGCTEKGKR